MNRLIVAFGLLLLTCLPFTGPTAAAQSAAEKFGTREPATCPDRKGPLNAENARKYVTCYLEGPYSDSMNLATNIVVQVGAPRAYIHGHDSGLEAIDVRQRVYDIRGSYIQYSCSSFVNLGYGMSKDRNCFKYTFPAATGRCWKDTFGDWHCNLGGTGDGNQQANQPPPTGH